MMNHSVFLEPLLKSQNNRQAWISWNLDYLSLWQICLKDTTCLLASSRYWKPIQRVRKIFVVLAVPALQERSEFKLKRWANGSKKALKSHFAFTRREAAYLIFVIFFPQRQLLVQFFSTQKCVNRDKTDFPTKVRKSWQNQFYNKTA